MACSIVVGITETGETYGQCFERLRWLRCRLAQRWRSEFDTTR
jgi:hypothetical protein